MHKRRLAAACFEGLARGREHAQAGAADEFQLRQVKDQVLDLTPENGRQLALEVRGGGRIEAAAEFHCDRPRPLPADAVLELDFKWHNGFLRFALLGRFWLKTL